MFRILLMAALGATFAADGADLSRAPVLVELFTSEGCSSCPPADRLLESLDPLAIVLSEHVDYWDRLGWRDPYSGHANTERQEAYARGFGITGPYTPQMVIDGITEFVGNDGRRAMEEIGRARLRQKIGVHLLRTTAGVEVQIDAAARAADVWLALADESGTSQVDAGENQGRRLHHVAILRSLRKIGAVKRGGGFARNIELPPGAGRVIVFVQEGGLGKVYGVAIL
jgi:hypothetical protein